MTCGESDRPPWHRLLAPLPAEAIPVRKPVGSPEVLEQGHGAAIAGWHHLSLNLSAGTFGLRHVLIVLDETGRPIADEEAAMLKQLVAEIVMRAG